MSKLHANAADGSSPGCTTMMQMATAWRSSSSCLSQEGINSQCPPSLSWAWTQFWAHHILETVASTHCIASNCWIPTAGNNGHNRQVHVVRYTPRPGAERSRQQWPIHQLHWEPSNWGLLTVVNLKIFYTLPSYHMEDYPVCLLPLHSIIHWATINWRSHIFSLLSCRA